MSPLQISVYCIVAVLSLCIVAEGNELARGFNDDIEWVSMEQGLELAKSQNKMLFLLIHKSWCGACKALKPKFAVSKEIEAMSKKFVMVNVMDDEEPKDRKYQPDGGYIPRILFLTPEGDVKVDLKNPNANPSYKYYYPNTEDVVKAMNNALDYHAGKNEEL